MSGSIPQPGVPMSVLFFTYVPELNSIRHFLSLVPDPAKPADRSTASRAHCPDVGKGTAWDGA